MSAAILLIAHGSRRAAANHELVDVASALRARIPDFLIEHAFLELAQPDIPQGLQRCRERGATSIRLLPYFLSPGAHVTEDLVDFCRQFQAENPEIPCTLSPPLGRHPLIMEILLDRLQQTLPVPLPSISSQEGRSTDA